MKYQLLKTRKGEIKYNIRKSKKARRVSIVIRPEGWAELVIPRFVPISLGEQFLRSKREWIAKKILQITDNPGMLRQNKPGEYQQYKGLALTIVKEKIRHYNSHYGFNVGKIFVRNQKSRWGSCSSDGNLSFNYKIVYLPEKVADYLVVHELCHLGQMNHSKKFWKLVAAAVPDYQVVRKKLKQL